MNVAPAPPANATRGLSAADAAARLARDGPNEFIKQVGPSALRILLRQLTGFMTWLLVAACVISGIVGDLADAIAIAVILVLNAAVGFFQEYRAERAVLALRALTAPHARVLRDGITLDLAARDVVTDDVLVLEAGDIVAADAVLLEAHVLATNEAALTGESVPSEKQAGPATPGAPLAERHTSLFAGTPVVRGSGRARVTAIGMETEIGRIAALLHAATDEDTPLKKRLEKVGRTLVILCMGIVGIVAVVGLLRGTPPVDVLLSAVSLAVAAVPEGLTAIVTIALALGVQRMAARHVLVRHLPAVETLGCATVICTDKTGTLTTGAMEVREVWGADRLRILDAAVACCDADLEGGSGDPTELALLRAGDAEGIQRARIEADRPRVHVAPFDSERKRMSILRADGVLYVKGAIDQLLPLCIAGTEGGDAENARLAGAGLRVLGVAIGASKEEAGLTLLGLVGIADPPRAEATAAVAQARDAGIQTVMITGDHPDTARAIAREMGILRDGDDADSIVHARATPQQKIDIVRGWKARGHVVAMTGDGVNDAPALKEAHIGIAMGKTGSEVAREASDMILTDDNFASIVAAIKEGRGVFDNIQKSLVYLLSGNASELFLMLGASLLGLPLPLTPLMILWINLVTDGLPALALVTDPARDDILKEPPRPTSEPILGRPQWTRIVLTGVLEMMVVGAVFIWALGRVGVDEARSLAFATLVFTEVFRSVTARSADKVFFQVGVFTNMRLFVVVAVTVALQLTIHFLPFAERLFGIAPLSLLEGAIAIGAGLIPATVLELRKLIAAALRRRAARQG